MALIPQAELDDLNARTDCVALAREYVTLRGSGRKKIGPCPICSPDPHSKTAGRFEVTSDSWVCAVCSDGGKALHLVMRAENLRLPDAVARLGGVRAIDPVEAARLEAARKAKRDKQERDAAAYREREREKLYGQWQGAAANAPDVVRGYFDARDLIMPPKLRVRFLPLAPYYHGIGDGAFEVIHSGPCMLAPILNAEGRFSGLHYTWLDLSQPNGKAVISHPTTGEILPSKKVRGTKAGGYIHLSGDPLAATTQISGEGIETTLALYTSMTRTRRATAHILFRAAIDLGNLAGRAIETVRHPTAKTDKGRPVRIPGDVPDMASPAMPVPEQIDELILLGDGDSDRVTTTLALVRAGRRHAREGRAIRCPMAPEGEDFDSWRRK